MKTDALAVSILAYVSLTAVASADPAMLLTDKGGDRVLEYDIATGMFVGVSASEDEHTGFDTPVSIEFLDGYVYVSATTSDVVGRYRLDDPFEAEVLVDKPTDGLGNPMGLTAGPDGRIYVADEG